MTLLPQVSPMQHAVTYLSLTAKHWFSTKCNLLDRIRRMDSVYVVDTNIDWARLSAQTELKRTAFILGTTLDHEIDGIINNPDRPQKIRENVFVFGLSTRRPAIVTGHLETPFLFIEALDKHFLFSRDISAVEEFAKSGKTAVPWNTEESIHYRKTSVQHFGSRLRERHSISG